MDYIVTTIVYVVYRLSTLTHSRQAVPVLAIPGRLSPYLGTCILGLAIQSYTTRRAIITRM